MKLKSKTLRSLMLTGAFILNTWSLSTYASNITVTNNTNFPGTAKLGNSPCSSSRSAAGSRGIIQPHEQNFVISEFAIGYFCLWSNCDAHVYASTNCSGPEVMTVTVNASDGIVSSPKYDDKQYLVSAANNHLTIEVKQQSRSGFFNWVKSLVS